MSGFVHHRRGLHEVRSSEAVAPGAHRDDGVPSWTVAETGSLRRDMEIRVLGGAESVAVRVEVDARSRDDAWIRRFRLGRVVAEQDVMENVFTRQIESPPAVADAARCFTGRPVCLRELSASRRFPCIAKQLEPELPVNHARIIRELANP